jgi:Ras-related protein Rab-11A
LRILASAGQERYRAITSAYYRGAVGVILCFDLTKHISFENIIKENGWFNEANTNCSNPKYILVGTKSDLTHLKDTNKTKIEEFIHFNSIPYIETSALDNTNIDKMMRNLVKEIYESNKSESSKKETHTVSNNINLIEVKQDKKDKKCCN